MSKFISVNTVRNKENDPVYCYIQMQEGNKIHDTKINDMAKYTSGKS